MGPSGTLDLDAFDRHVAWVIDQGVHGVVPCGTTGESAALDADEQAELVRRSVAVAAGRVPVVAGAGGNDTRIVCDLARRAAEAGADALLVVTPPYNRPSANGLVEHYRAVAQAGGLPIVLYNVPGRTGLNTPPEVVLRIAAEVPEVVAVKESAGRLDQLVTLLAERPDNFTVLSGDDDLALPSLAAGADGVISVAANEVPAAMVALFDATTRNDLAEARQLYYTLLPLLRANFVESNPAPLKAALELMGRGTAALRLPLTPVTAESRRVIEDALRAAGVLS